MRRVLISLIAISLVTSLTAGAVDAQEGRKIGFGVKGGATNSKLRGDFFDQEIESIDPSWNWRVGYALGVSVNVPIQRGFSFMPEVFLTRRTSGITVGAEGITVRTHYLEVPLLLKYTVQRESSFRPVLLGGGSVAFELDSHSTIVDDGVSETENISDVLRRRDIGLVVGGGFDVYHNDKIFHLEGRFTLGLTDVVTAEAQVDSGRFKFSVITVLAGVTF